jgi:hypothetical protein
MKTRLIWLIIPWALFAAAAIGWTIYWHAVANAAETRVRDWIAAHNAGGGEAAVTSITRGGFPVLLRLELNGVALAPARGGWRVTTDRADIHVALTNPQHVKLEARAPILAARANGDLTTIAADALIGSLRTQDGALAVAGLEADNLTLDDPAKEGVLAVRKLVANLRPDPRAAGDVQLALELSDITLPRPVRSFEAFGLEAKSLRAAIVIERAPALMQSGDSDPLGPWRDAGGKMRFETLALDWGPLQASGTGTGGLDSERRLQGAMTLPIARPAPIFTALANAPDADQDARRALALLAAAYSLSGDDISLDVEAQSGVLRLEGVGVRLLPPMY